MQQPGFQRLCISALFILTTTISSAQTPPAYNTADIYQQLKKLNVLGSVLYIAAHPDDENTRLLTYFANEGLYRTGYLSLTRGDGGQNLIGDEQGIDLGLIRTQELLAARRIDGAEQFFSRAYDFGFSKTAEESLRFWNHDRILSDVVWVIRTFQPDLIVTRFPGDARAGHGHHAASSILAVEGFAAAADATRYPEQLKQGVKPWQAKRILWNTFNFGNNNTVTNDQFKIDAGGFNALLGKSYGEIAALSRSQHKSQGFGVPAQRGRSFEYVDVLGGTPVNQSLFDGIDTTWNRVEGGASIQQQVNDIISSFNLEHPEGSVPALVRLHQALAALPNGYWKQRKQAEVQQLILECSGIYAEAVTGAEFGVQQQPFTVQFLVDKRLDVNASLKSVQLISMDTAVNTPLATNTNLVFSHRFTVDADMPVSQPYWLQHGIDSIGSFKVEDQLLIGKPQNDAAYSARFTFNIEGTAFTVEKPVQYKFTDPVKGEQYQPFIVISPLSIAVQPAVVLTNVKQAGKPLKLDLMQVRVKSFAEVKQVPLQLFFVQEKDSTLLADTLVDLEYNRVYDFSFPLSRFYKNRKGAPSVAVRASINNKAVAYNGDLRSIQYDHIPYIHYYATDEVQVINEPVTTVGTQIGYIAGAGDKLPQSLQQMGYRVTMLGENDITPVSLRRFDAVITGVRAYNVHHWLGEKYSTLMGYVQQGGNLIVQYNTNNQVGSVKASIGPYNFNISRTRVTEEITPVRMLLPNHPVFNYPNKITNADFEHWVQERSTYQADQLDARYEALLGMHDAGEAESTGALITARYGKGNFVYAGLVFFRQLPAGVPGAYRLMANLIALPKEK